MDKAIKRRLEELEASVNNKTAVLNIAVVFVSPSRVEGDDKTLEEERERSKS